MNTSPSTTSPPVRRYEVVAIRVPIVYDTYGDHERDGRMYTLRQHVPRLRRLREEFPDPFPDPISEPDRMPKPHPLVRPLVLRARLGERVEIEFHNELRDRAGIHVQGADYDINTADGGAVGDNPDSSVEPGGSGTYVWNCRTEGTFFFGDIADLRGHEDAANARGLFGALIVEPAQATWTDPVSGEPLLDGLNADVHVPGEPSFREYTVIMHDETSNDNPLLPQSSDAEHKFVADDHRSGEGSGHSSSESSSSSGASGSMPGMSHGADAAVSADMSADSMSSSPSSLPPSPLDSHVDAHSVMLLNYRTEPAGGRFRMYDEMMRRGILDPQRDRIVGEEQHHSSWMFGDPSTPILRAYRGDRAKIRLLHGGVFETHVFHLHVHQWHAVPGNEASPILDSISLGPQQGFDIEPIGGAGSVQKAIGDIIFHCHLYPHFHSGMWGMWRVFDVLQDGSGQYPNGMPITQLQPLPGHEQPPRPTPSRPGWPAFMDGEFPRKSPRPPRTPRMPEGIGREPSELEQNAFVDDPRPGEAFVKVAPDDAPLRTYDIVVMEGKLVYHQTGDGTQWYDERGAFYVLREEIDAAGGIERFQRELEEGTRTVEPLAIRANKGDLVQLSLTNALPPGRHEETHFDPAIPFQPECGLHVHLVKFDPLVSDGASVGWNYLSGATTEDQGKEDFARYNTWIYRWYCDEEFGTIFFHDHLLANERQRHGLFATMIAEPEGAQWTTPQGEPLSNGSQAVVRHGDGEEYREQVIAFGDFVPLYRKKPGEEARPVNPPNVPGDPEDHGALAINYRCEPLVERSGDPAEWFSSTTHGDPQTPVARGYPGEELRLRLYQGSHEEQHSFRVSGMRWRRWWKDPTSPLVDQQTIGISEAFTHRITDSFAPGDYHLSFTTADDLWMGAWSLIRLYDSPRAGLPPLAGAFQNPALPAFEPAAARRFHVAARAEELHYSDQRTDPLAGRFIVDGAPQEGPLVLRCRQGEWVEVVLTNELHKPLEASPFDPRLSEFDNPSEREISPRVSLHPSGMLRFDVRDSDGSNVGFNPDTTAHPTDAAGTGGGRWNLDFNPDGTIKAFGSTTYRWYADTPGVVLLEDRADPRTHRHRGLIGALVVEPPAATPIDPATGEENWTGEKALIRQGDQQYHELVLLLQDGLRLYHDGDHTQPVRDLDNETADAGQNGFNYRSAHLRPLSPSLARTPPTPVLECAPGDQIRVHLAIASDRARNHTFQIHGHTWPMEDHVATPRVGAIGALATGGVRSTTLTAGPPGDYAYRSGVLRWHLTEGEWGLIRVRE